MFETFNTSMHALAKDLTELLDKYDFREKIISYVNYDGSNLNTMTIIWKFIVSYDI